MSISGIINLAKFASFASVKGVLEESVSDLYIHVQVLLWALFLSLFHGWVDSIIAAWDVMAEAVRCAILF